MKRTHLRHLALPLFAVSLAAAFGPGVLPVQAQRQVIVTGVLADPTGTAGGFGNAVKAGLDYSYTFTIDAAMPLIATTQSAYGGTESEYGSTDPKYAPAITLGSPYAPAAMYTGGGGSETYVAKYNGNPADPYNAEDQEYHQLVGGSATGLAPGWTLDYADVGGVGPGGSNPVTLGDPSADWDKLPGYQYSQFFVNTIQDAAGDQEMVTGSITNVAVSDFTVPGFAATGAGAGVFDASYVSEDSSKVQVDAYDPQDQSVPPGGGGAELGLVVFTQVNAAAYRGESFSMAFAGVDEAQVLAYLSGARGDAANDAAYHAFLGDLYRQDPLNASLPATAILFSEGRSVGTVPAGTFANAPTGPFALFGVAPEPAPEPSPFASLALGILGLGALGWRAHKRA